MLNELGNKPTKNCYTEKLQDVLDANSIIIQSFVDKIAPKITELTPLVKDKFLINKDMFAPANILHDINKTTEILDGYDANLQLVVRVYENHVVYALEKINSRQHISQKLIITDNMPSGTYPDGLVEINWIDEKFMSCALSTHSYVSSPLNQCSIIWEDNIKDNDDTIERFVDLFDKRHFE